MPTFEINGQTVELTDAQSRQLLNRLITLVRRQMFNAPMLRFDRWYDYWRFHNRAHDFNVVVLVAEAIGGVSLPPQSQVNRLRSTRQQLERLLNPRGIHRFMSLFPRWQRECGRFCNHMVRYQNAFESGANTAIRVLEITRDRSFQVLQACAIGLTGGAAAPASAAGALAAEVAMAFTINEMQNSATRLGRAMAGNPPTVDETLDDVVSSIINAAQGAALGRILSPVMAPMSGSVGDLAMREMQRGNLAGAVSTQLVADQMDTIVQDTITEFIGTSETDVRRLLEQCRSARNQRDLGNQMGTRLMQNRAFRQRLERNIQRAADRSR